MKRPLAVELEDDTEPRHRRVYDVRLRLTWHNPETPGAPAISSAWRDISRRAMHQRDDASQWTGEQVPTAVPIFVECSARVHTGDKEYGPWTLRWRSTHNVLAHMAPPINRPRCELAAAHVALAALFRRWPDAEPVWPPDTSSTATAAAVVHKIYCLQPSAYVAAHATPARLRTWKKRRYRTIANQDLWERLEGAFFRLGDAALEFYEWPAAKAANAKS